LTSSGDLDVILHVPGELTYGELAPRAVTVELSGVEVLFACDDDIIRSKEAAGRPKDSLALSLLEPCGRGSHAPALLTASRGPQRYGRPPLGRRGTTA
jgi:hypothetical protein